MKEIEQQAEKQKNVSFPGEGMEEYGDEVYNDEED